MRTCMTRIAFGALVFFTLGADDCSSTQEPTDAGIRIAQQLDLGRMHGEVVNKRIGNYAEAHSGIDAAVGDPYYCLDIQTMSTAGQRSNTAYCGVRQVVYDSVEIGTLLPIARTYTVYEIAQLHGRIVDRRADPERSAWYVIVDHATEVKVYRVDPQSYYRSLELGLVLPFIPPRGGMTASDVAQTTANAP